MLVKIATWIVLEVRDEEQAEVACQKLEDGLDRALADFPVGELIDTEVDRYEKVSDDEADEKGWTE